MLFLIAAPESINFEFACFDNHSLNSRIRMRQHVAACEIPNHPVDPLRPLKMTQTSALADEFVDQIDNPFGYRLARCDAACFRIQVHATIVGSLTEKAHNAIGVRFTTGIHGPTDERKQREILVGELSKEHAPRESDDGDTMGHRYADYPIAGGRYRRQSAEQRNEPNGLSVVRRTTRVDGQQNAGEYTSSQSCE